MTTTANPPELPTAINYPRLPFQPLEKPILKDVGELNEALALFKTLKTDPDPSIQSYLPSPSLLSAMQQLIDLHSQQLEVAIRKSSSLIKTPPNCEIFMPGNSDSNLTPKMIQRNALGGRAWLSKSTPHSRRKRKKYGATVATRKFNYIANLHSDKSINQGGKKTVPKVIQFDKKVQSSCSPVGISATQEQLSQDEDFAFHSQSSLPKK